ncbi:septum formation inhibitor Maf [Rhodococcus rhodnii]|uniref:Nucleoside triphosphate pyrophosphatase n=2 Tax=Rhodococcus rhodnii TaxID=38312 RepID=R7WN35_9NOCA|nr:nucleoside triphosphate pyrophosphatase [Rhodococcus rhodnii]EOM75404.1 Maf-like protein [Rhodococcus rhodnii LMG 5362]TXG90561.1 septum formation inhibitor Maf [Rhodococcus rhodnii]
MTTFVLASASPARLAVLRAAGIDPVVRVSGVDEDAVTAGLGPDPAPELVVGELARAKATAVIEAVTREGIYDAVIVGCDSMLLIDGELQGKPGTVDAARTRWRTMAGGSGTLLTGHSIVHISNGVTVGERHAHTATVVHFATPTDAELEAYLASGEPLAVAGAFTLDALGGWFVERIEGDPSSVVGIGLPLVRSLLTELGFAVSDLWSVPREI